jgi:thiol-disulfide isomerase/thioredoxin
MADTSSPTPPEGGARFIFGLRKLKRREKGALLILGVTGLFAALLWRPINRSILTEAVFRAQRPAQSLVNEVIGQAKDPAAVLERLWRTEKIPHRVLAITYLKEHASTSRALLQRMNGLLLAAAADGDLEVRDLALAALGTQVHPELVGQLTGQLSDVDPAARVLALSYLRNAGNSRLAPLLIPLLDDPSPQVVAYTASDLRAWTGQDFGVRTSQVPRKFNDDPSEKPDPAAAERFKQGVQRWKEWWNLHKQDYPNLPEAAAQTIPSWRLPAPDFLLEDLAGKPIGLLALRGRAVLIHLWDTVSTNCLADLPVLNELQRRNSNRLVVLSVSLDSTADERADCCEAEHAGGHHPKLKLGTIRAQVTQLAKNRRVEYPVLIDPTGSVGWRFLADDLPTYILIDGDGQMRRRFVGGRDLRTLEAMVAEVAPAAGSK